MSGLVGFQGALLRSHFPSWGGGRVGGLHKFLPVSNSLNERNPFYALFRMYDISRHLKVNTRVIYSRPSAARRLSPFPRTGHAGVWLPFPAGCPHCGVAVEGLGSLRVRPCLGARALCQVTQCPARQEAGPGDPIPIPGL